MAITPYQGTITTTYQGEALTLYQEQSAVLDIARYPVLMSEPQFDAILCKARIFAVLKGTSQTPSVKAGVLLDKRCDVLIRLDDIYQTSLDSYKKSIHESIRKDAATITNLEATPIVEGYVGPGGYVITPFLAGLYGLIRSFTDHAAIVKRNGSAYRITRLIEIGVLEERRLAEIKTVITEACRPIMTRLGELHAAGETDIALLSKLSQLQKVYKAEFGDDIQIDTTNIATYLTEITVKYPSLTFE